MSVLRTVFGGVFGFFSRYPMAMLYVVLTGMVVTAWLHYQGLRSDLRSARDEVAMYRVELEAQRGATQSAVDRAEELARDFRDFQTTIDMLEAKDDEIRKETRRLRERLAGLRLQEAVEADPVLAGGVATDEYGAARRLLDCASGAGSTCEAAGEGAARAAPPGTDTLPGR